METKFKKLSKNRGITIPKDLIAHLGWDSGDALDLTPSREGMLIISRHVPRCRFCNTPENVVIFGDVCTCTACVEKMNEEVKRYER